MLAYERDAIRAIGISDDVEKEQNSVKKIGMSFILNDKLEVEFSSNSRTDYIQNFQIFDDRTANKNMNRYKIFNYV